MNITQQSESATGGSAGAHGSATFDTEHRDNIVCPYCGYEERDSWEVDFGPGLEGETEHECAHCGQTMKAERRCTVTYTTAKSPNAADQRPADKKL